MRKFFRQLSLSKKLMLIGLVPLAFLAYTAVQLYKEKALKVQLLQLYSGRIYRSERIASLIEHLQHERKYSFDYSIDSTMVKNLGEERASTDRAITSLQQTNDATISDFASYTFINTLPDIRERIDKALASPGEVMNAYTNMIFRLNTLNSTFPASNIFLQPAAQDLASQKLLTEMITYLGIIRSNIFNILHSRQYVTETLIGSNGVYLVYQTYETEFKLKASPSTLKTFRQIRNGGELKTTLDYIDTVFKTFKVNNTYNAETWWQVSDKGIDKLADLQKEVWNNTKKALNTLLKEEKREKNETLIFLIAAMVLVLVSVSFTIHIITSTLNELKRAAEKIANEEEDVKLDINSNDAIGSLADSIQIMEEKVRLRTQQLREINTELERSNRDLEQFAYIASHDLQEPVRKIRTFAERIVDGSGDNLDENAKRFLDKISSSAERMKKIISDLLEFAHLSRHDEQFTSTDLNKIISDILVDLELVISQKKAKIIVDRFPAIDAIPLQMNQLFYNLLNNALKFSAEDRLPVIEITRSPISKEMLAKLPNALSPSDYIQIDVADNGIGFDQEYANKIFTMFQRLSVSHEGTGIGLALCKKIVENHKGHIEAISTSGEGSVFRITLPKAVKKL